jgi:hypothetical protein
MDLTSARQPPHWNPALLAAPPPADLFSFRLFFLCFDQNNIRVSSFHYWSDPNPSGVWLGSWQQQHGDVCLFSDDAVVLREDAELLPLISTTDPLPPLYFRICRRMVEC